MVRGLIVCALALVFTGVAAAEGVYGDSNGEPNGGYPMIDISSVAVSNDPAAGSITFRVALAGAPAIVGSARVLVAVWPDGSGVNGPPAHTLTFGPGGAGDDAAAGSYAQGVVTLTADVAALGISRSVSFEALSIPDAAAHASTSEDVAPDVGTWSYTLSKAEPPPPAATTVTQVSARFAGKPHHGATFHVLSLAVQLSTGASATAAPATCVGHIGHALVEGTGAGGCAFRLPKTSKGKQLDVVTTGMYGSETISSSDALAIG
jgi:hypothetical protein